MRSTALSLQLFISTVFIYCLIQGAEGGVFLKTKQRPPMYLAIASSGLVFTANKGSAHEFTIERPGNTRIRGSVSIKSKDGRYIRAYNARLFLSKKSSSDRYKSQTTFLENRNTFVENTVTFEAPNYRAFIFNAFGRAGFRSKTATRGVELAVSFELVDAAPPSTARPAIVMKEEERWTSCDRTCGTGMQLKIKLCPATGCQREFRACKLADCPQPGIKCSKQCGGGIAVTPRQCHGRICIGGIIIRCNTHPCRPPVKSVSMCSHNLCGTHGRCFEVFGGFACACAFGYSGHYCDRSGACNPNPCLNNGECRPAGSGFSCSCHKDYEGDRCESEIVKVKDHCSPNPCRHGDCKRKKHGFTCACPPGYAGKTCHKVTDVCLAEKPCKNGVCEKISAKEYSCNCPPPYMGKNCESVIDPCSFNPCVNGQCETTGQSFQCNCDPGYVGETCEVSSNPCDPNPCDQGACATTGVGFECLCDPWATGERCEIAFNACEPNPCNNGGCGTSGSGFTCFCDPGFTGETCDIQIKVNFCENDPCINGGKCSSSDIDYICECPEGYMGVHCEEAINPCIPNPCSNGGCGTSGLGFTCFCDPGFTGETCDIEIKVNFCENNPCKNGGKCSSSNIDYTCECPEGYMGVHCEEEIDHCKADPCINGECVSTLQEYLCMCFPGYGGDDCKDVIDACVAAAPCKNGECRPLSADGEYMCLCPPTHTGYDCETRIDPCAASPCVRGSCVTNSHGFECICPKSHTGPTCDEAINFCESIPCVHGECLLKDGIFQCLCHSGYKGGQCSEEIDFCEENPCEHGTCTTSTSGPVCACDEGYTGKLCQSLIDYCTPNPCKDGTCVKMVGGFSCDCGVGKSGALCETVDVCLLNPCVNGACQKKDVGYECICDKGYTGKNCDEAKGPCESIPCQNGGTCMSVDADYWCVCTDGYKGKHCEESDVFDVYTKCTKTCGGGSRYKIPKCDEDDITKCPKIFEGCNYGACPLNPVCKIDPNMRYKYKSLSTECCTKSDPDQVCGVEGEDFVSRIIGGYAAKQGAWPWAVLLHVATSRSSNSTCGSTLISPVWLLTAAHCVEGIVPEQVTAILGTTNPSLHHLSMQERRVEKFIIHEDFSYPLVDIALIKLDKPAEINKNVRPICLPMGERIGTDTNCFAVGWGIAKVEDIIRGIPSEDLMEVGLKNLEFGVCKSGYRGTSAYSFLNPKMLCAGSVDGGVDTCMGDSGGPLMCQRCDSCSWYIAGITSFGSSHCGVAGRPGVYTNVLLFEEWIRKHVDIKPGKHTCSK